MSGAVLALEGDLGGDAGVWTLAWRRFRSDCVGMVSFAIVLLFVLLALGTGLRMVAADWAEEAAPSNAPPKFIRANALPQGTAVGKAEPPAPGTGKSTNSNISHPPPEPSAIPDPLADDLAAVRRQATSAVEQGPKNRALLFGADKWGRDVLKKTVKGTETSLYVGLAAALLATVIGTLFGAAAGYFGGRWDAFFNWLYSVFTAVPYLLLVLAIAAVLNRRGTSTVIVILALTGWTAIFRLVRAEYLKHREREYVLAAEAVGASDLSRMFAHILPNVSHVVLVQFSLHVVLFIKSEVVLSFLGFGVGVDTVSWGSMLNEAQTELLLGYWWQMAAATAAMALLVTAVSLATDALRDALDPRLQG